MLPINWLNHHEFPDVNVEIALNFYNAYCTPKSFFVEKYFDSWDPKIHGTRNYLQSYVASLIDEYYTKKHYPLSMFRNSISKKTRSSVIGMTEDGIPLSSSDSEMTSKEKKNCCATFKIQMKINFLFLKEEYDTLFKNR